MFGLFKSKKSSPAKPGKTPKPITLHVDDKVNIKKDENTPKLWRGNISSITEDTFSVEIPEFAEEGNIPFQTKTSLYILVPREDRSARFYSKVLSTGFNSKIPFIKLEYPTEVTWEEVRERKFVRIPANVPAKVKLTYPADSPWEMIRITDFSLNGLAFKSSKPYKKDNLIMVNLISMQYMLNLTAQIVRVMPIEEETGGEKISIIGAEFVDLSETDRQTVVNFTYYLQRTKEQ